MYGCTPLLPSFRQRPIVYDARSVFVMSYAALILPFVMCVLSRPLAPSTFAGASSLFRSGTAPVVPEGTDALVMYVSGWLLLFW
jgi:hypothetical protein